MVGRSALDAEVGVRILIRVCGVVELDLPHLAHNQEIAGSTPASAIGSSVGKSYFNSDNNSDWR